MRWWVVVLAVAGCEGEVDVDTEEALCAIMEAHVDENFEAYGLAQDNLSDEVTDVRLVSFDCIEVRTQGPEGTVTAHVEYELVLNPDDPPEDHAHDIVCNVERFDQGWTIANAGLCGVTNRSGWIDN